MVQTKIIPPIENETDGEFSINELFHVICALEKIKGLINSINKTRYMIKESPYILKEVLLSKNKNRLMKIYINMESIRNNQKFLVIETAIQKQIFVHLL